MAGQVQVEGVDGAGKSTIISQLSRGTCPVVTYTETQKKSIVAGQSWMKWVFYSSRKFGPVIYDRFYPSQVAYEAAMDRKGLSPTEHWAVEGWCLARGGVVLLCQPPDDVLADNIRSGRHHYPVEWLVSKIGRLKEEYQRYIVRAYLPIILYDYTMGNGKETIEMLRGLLESNVSIDQGTGFGSPTPELIIVGEKRREGAPRKADLPFCSPAAMSAGEYLRRALERAGLGLNRVYVTNSIEPNRAITLAEEVALARRFTEAEVLALGDVADVELTKVGIPHRKVPHPQFWRRFHFKDIDEYARMIKGDLS